MYQLGKTSLILGVLLLAAADRPPDAATRLKNLVDKVEKAAGSEKEGAGLSWKGRGKSIVNGLEFDGEWTVAGPERVRIRTTGEWDGKKHDRLLILNGGKGWIKVGKVVDDLTREAHNEELARAYVNWLYLTLPLKNKEARLKLLDARKVDGKMADVLEVAWDARPDCLLFFDRESGLLVRSESQFKDPKNGQRVTQAVTYHDYREFAGVQRATKIVVLWNDKKVSELEYKAFEHIEKVDEALFEKPSP